VRHGSTVAHVATAKEAAEIMERLARMDSGATQEAINGSEHLTHFQKVLSEAGAILKLDKKITSEDVRSALVRKGAADVAKKFVLWRDERRAVAHPPGRIASQVLAALRRAPVAEVAKTEERDESEIEEYADGSTEYEDTSEKGQATDTDKEKASLEAALRQATWKKDQKKLELDQAAVELQQAKHRLKEAQEKHDAALEEAADAEEQHEATLKAQGFDVHTEADGKEGPNTEDGEAEHKRKTGKSEDYQEHDKVGNCVGKESIVSLSLATETAKTLQQLESALEEIQDYWRKT